MRIALGIEYNGSNYSGWQKQTHSSSIQSCIESALSQVANSSIQVVCAGRTDAGVHALEQVVHFDTDIIRPVKSWVLGSNTHLNSAIRILWAVAVNSDFHARFSAESRSYQYVILNRVVRPAYLHRLVTHEYRLLDIKLMQQAAKYLIGKHDFNSYRAKHCQSKTPIRTIFQLDIRRNNNFVIIDIKANAFLHHMVRNIVGVLIKIGSQEEVPEWADQVLQLKSRQHRGLTASADGLYLTSVYYPDCFKLPKLSCSAAVW